MGTQCCWKDYHEWLEENGQYMSDEWANAFSDGGTCMAADGHAGPHEFIPDSDVSISFPETAS